MARPMFPKAVKYKRGGANSPEPAIKHQRISEARKLLNDKHDDDLVADMLAGSLRLDAAVKKSEKRKVERSTDTHKLGLLRASWSEFSTYIMAKKITIPRQSRMSENPQYSANKRATPGQFQPTSVERPLVRMLPRPLVRALVRPLVQALASEAAARPRYLPEI